MIKFIIINGGHACGKTTLIKNIINHFNNNFEEIKTKFGYYTKLNKDIYFCGKVTSKVTGGDQCGYNNIFPIILYILNNEKNIKYIILESPMFSSNFSTPLKFLSYLKLNYNIEIINILLHITNMEIIYKRCFNRTGKELNEEQKRNVDSRQKSIYRSFIKKYIFNYINSCIIDITNMTKEELLNKILEFIY